MKFDSVERPKSYFEGKSRSHTNRFIPMGTKVITKAPIFWCELCQKKLDNHITARKHFNGKVTFKQVVKQKNR